ncbi:MAG: hypothetical protein ACXWP0_01200 [Ktedonobacterales bacterium]
MAKMKIPTKPKTKYRYSGKSTGDGPCIICGREVIDAKYYVHMCGGGTLACTPDEDEDVKRHDSGDLGVQYIGGHQSNGCTKWLKDQHPEFFKLYVRKV